MASYKWNLSTTGLYFVIYNWIILVFNQFHNQHSFGCFEELLLDTDQLNYIKFTCIVIMLIS